LSCYFYDHSQPLLYLLYANCAAGLLFFIIGLR